MIENIARQFVNVKNAYRSFESAGAVVEMARDQIKEGNTVFSPSAIAETTRAADIYRGGLTSLRNVEIFAAGALALSAIGAEKDKRTDRLLAAALTTIGVVLTRGDINKTTQLKNDLQPLR